MRVRWSLPAAEDLEAVRRYSERYYPPLSIQAVVRYFYADRLFQRK